MINFKEKYKVFIWSILIALVFCIVFPWLKDIFSGEQGRVRKFILQGKRAVEAEDTKKQASVEIVALVIGVTQADKEEKILEGEKGRLRVKLIKKDRKWHLQEVESFESSTIMGRNIS